MKTFYINQETGDFEMDEQNQFKMVEGDDAIKQGIWVNITTNLGEYFLDREKGLDRFSIIGKKYNEERILEEVTDAILQHPMVESVEDISIAREGRMVKVRFVAKKIDDGIIEGVEII